MTPQIQKPDSNLLPNQKENKKRSILPSSWGGTVSLLLTILKKAFKKLRLSPQAHRHLKASDAGLYFGPEQLRAAAAPNVFNKAGSRARAEAAERALTSVWGGGGVTRGTGRADRPGCRRRRHPDNRPSCLSGTNTALPRDTCCLRNESALEARRRDVSSQAASVQN